MRCPGCQTDNPADAAYCIVCARRLEPSAAALAGRIPTTEPPPTVPKQSIVNLPVKPVVDQSVQPDAGYQPAFPAPVPGLARAAAILGWLSMATMVSGLVIVPIGNAIQSDVVPGFGFLLGILALPGALLASIFGLVVLVRQQTAEPATTRAALTGIASMGVLLVGCCVMLVLAPTS